MKKNQKQKLAILRENRRWEGGEGGEGDRVGGGERREGGWTEWEGEKKVSIVYLTNIFSQRY